VCINSTGCVADPEVSYRMHKLLPSQSVPSQFYPWDFSHRKLVILLRCNILVISLDHNLLPCMVMNLSILLLLDFVPSLKHITCLGLLTCGILRCVCW